MGKKVSLGGKACSSICLKAEILLHPLADAAVQLLQHADVQPLAVILLIT